MINEWVRIKEISATEKDSNKHKNKQKENEILNFITYLEVDTFILIHDFSKLVANLPVIFQDTRSWFILTVYKSQIVILNLIKKLYFLNPHLIPVLQQLFNHLYFYNSKTHMAINHWIISPANELKPSKHRQFLLLNSCFFSLFYLSLLEVFNCN